MGPYPSYTLGQLAHHLSAGELGAGQPCTMKDSLKPLCSTQPSPVLPLPWVASEPFCDFSSLCQAWDPPCRMAAPPHPHCACKAPGRGTSWFAPSATAAKLP